MHAKEFVGVESLGQRYMFLGEVFEAVEGVTTVIHEDACHLRKYASKREGQSDLARRLAFPDTCYIVDRFHSMGAHRHLVQAELHVRLA